MKFVLVHGSGQGPDMWLPWLKKELEKLGHQVWMPTMPDAEEITFEKHLPFLLQSGEITSDCVLVGHSAGCRLILKALEEANVRIRKSVLVAGSYRNIEFDFQKIKQKCADFIFVVSDNDPWGCDDRATRPYFDHLGGKLLVVKDGGHFGSNTFGQPIYELPFVLDLAVSGLIK